MSRVARASSHFQMYCARRLSTAAETAALPFVLIHRDDLEIVAGGFQNKRFIDRAG